jgi:hypothetical protein
MNLAQLKREVELSHSLKVEHKPRWSAHDMAIIVFEIETLLHERDTYRDALLAMDHALNVARKMVKMEGEQ